MFKKNNLLQCTITLTRNCNLRCSFCYAKKEGYIDKNRIDYEDVVKIIDFCNEAKVKYIVLTGGEPVTYYKIIDALKYIQTKTRNMIPAISTNGVLLSDFAKCQELIDNGLKYIDISLKGSSAEQCYEITDRDCFSEQIKAIGNFAKLPIEMTCSMVLTKYNIESFCEAVKNAYHNGAKQFSFTFVIDNEDSIDKGLTYLEKNNPLYLIEFFIKQVDQLNKITTNWWIEYSFPICFYTEKQLYVLKNKLATKCQIHTKNCITIDTKLNLLPCNMYTDLSMGRFGMDFKSYKEFNRYRKSLDYKDVSDRLDFLPSGKCLACKYLKSCYGGCPLTWKNFSFEDMETFKIINK